MVRKASGPLTMRLAASLRQGAIDPRRLVFLDETWAKTNMAPLRGWAPKGERLIGRAPYGHRNTLTFLAALRCDRIEAPWVLAAAWVFGAFGLFLSLCGFAGWGFHPDVLSTLLG